MEKLKDYELEALKQIEKKLKKEISTADTNLKAVASADITAKDLCSVEYDGCTYSSYEEIQEAYGCGVITSKRFDMLCNELMDKRKKAGLSYQIAKGEYLLSTWKKLYKLIYDTIHWED